MRATTVCAEPGCGEEVRSGRCSRHRRASFARSRPYDTRWRRRRAEYLASHPTCECDECALLPEDSRPRATDVHHVLGVVTGERERDEDLRAYTHGHHSKETARMQPGGWNSLQQRDRIRGPVQPSNPGREARVSGR
jgi:5-methylcytosine-specific restriction enzyme A